MTEEQIKAATKKVPAKGDVETTGEVEKWDYGHLIMQCYKCGHKYESNYK